MKKLFSNIFVRIALIIAFIFLFDFLSNQISQLVGNFVESILKQEFTFEGILKKIIMILLCFITMFLIPGYKLRDFGFRKPENVNYFRIIWLTLVLVVGSLIIFTIIYQGILANILGSTGKPPAAATGEGQSFLSIVIGIWILSSISEEIETRALYQSLLNKLTKYKFLGLSIAVWLSGLLFGLLHISVYSPGNLLFTLQIISGAIVLGLLAAYYREKTGSIYIAIVVHMLGNIYAGILMFLSKL